jgi:hypothetical protein
MLWRCRRTRQKKFPSINPGSSYEPRRGYQEMQKAAAVFFAEVNAGRVYTL